MQNSTRIPDLYTRVLKDAAEEIAHAVALASMPQREKMAEIVGDSDIILHPEFKLWVERCTTSTYEVPVPIYRFGLGFTGAMGKVAFRTMHAMLSAATDLPNEPWEEQGNNRRVAYCMGGNHDDTQFVFDTHPDCLRLEVEATRIEKIAGVLKEPENLETLSRIARGVQMVEKARLSGQIMPANNVTADLKIGDDHRVKFGIIFYHVALTLPQLIALNAMDSSQEKLAIKPLEADGSHVFVNIQTGNPVIQEKLLSIITENTKSLQRIAPGGP